MAANRNFELLTTVPAAIAKPIVMRSWRVKLKSMSKELNEKIAAYMQLKKLSETEWINPVLAQSTNHLAYHESWGWLMPVVEKIMQTRFEEDGENYYLISFGMLNSGTDEFMVRFNRHQLFQHKELITATWLAVNDAIDLMTGSHAA